MEQKERNSIGNRSPDISLQEWVYVSEVEQEKMAENDEQTEKSTWLDDVPVDKEHSGVGFAYNQVYKDDGYKHEDHTFEDKCFRLKLADDCYLYGVFDGHCGEQAAEFVSQRLPAEIMLDQLDNVKSDEDIKTVLQQAYQTVESSYFSFIDDLIAERTGLQQELSALAASSLDAQHKAKLERLRKIDRKVSSGTSALVALIYREKLFVANVGNSRALLCRTQNKRLQVERLNDDHTLENETEVQRLANLGLPIDQIRKQTKFGQQLYTRCIGDYSVKGGYRDNEQMSCAVSEPVIADPDIEDALEIDSSCNFLLLMSDGVYRSLTDATNTEHVNADIASMVATEFSRQSTLNGVGQAVIDKITRIHHDTFTLSAPDASQRTKCAVRDDMTLMIRNFNYKLKAHSPEKVGLTHSTSTVSAYSPNSTEESQSVTPQTTNKTMTDLSTNPFFAQLANSNKELYDTYIENSDSLADSIKSTASATLELDSDGRLEPYVNFDVFDKALAAMEPEERKKFLEMLTPRMDCETIMEQPESPNDM